ncbi:MAG: helix-turn-helix domain-containing protein [Pseudomonadota bacterium]|nr:helix-turn-helix domain-containing protein [Gammaproteobacteria bacterium]MBU1559010.1 helix-turn-helix domain-containing protein [Gammaproteobacteria bacterium]MBU1629186.1 helix-turn-helix domain-containing protein [Gammaproteobacteria bacterium]MBU1926685.1 helix-turn-helix domain-containing protein [Gammaproteobacteria bacterium]MBU2545929.1 helix-turn-helix domain-containing protein [Gammaproteobacteria bacterium]
MDQNNEINPSEEKRQMSFLLNIGSKLHAAREAMSMSIEDAADHLRVSPQVIQTIETDAYQKEDLNTFTRGYIRSYARLVHVPVEEIEKAFEKMGLQTKPMQHTVSRSVPSMPVCSYKRRPVYYLLLGILAFFIVAGYVSHHYRTSNATVDAVKEDQTQSLSSDTEATDVPSSSDASSSTPQPVDVSKDQSSQPQVLAPADTLNAPKQEPSQQSQVPSDASQQTSPSNTTQQAFPSNAAPAPVDQTADVPPAQDKPVIKPWVNPDSVSDTAPAQQQ